MSEPPVTRLIENIRQRMAELDMNQMDLARAGNFTSPQLSVYLTEKRAPSIGVLVRIAAALKTTPARLLAEPDEQPSPAIARAVVEQAANAVDHFMDADITAALDRLRSGVRGLHDKLRSMNERAAAESRAGSTSLKAAEDGAEPSRASSQRRQLLEIVARLDETKVPFLLRMALSLESGVAGGSSSGNASES